MKNFKTIFFALLCVSLISCSNDDDDDNSGETYVYFNFQANGYDYSIEETYSGFDLCYGATLNQNGSVSILSSYKHPIEELVYCGVGIDLSDNHLGNHNNVSMYISMGQEYVGADDVQLELIDNGSYYIGSFSGEFLIYLDGVLSTEQGTGSFRIPFIE